MPLSDCDAIVADGGLRSASRLREDSCFRKKGVWAKPLRGTALFAALTEPADAVSTHAGDDPLAAQRGVEPVIRYRGGRCCPRGLSRLVAGNGHGPWRGRGCTHSAGQQYGPRPSPQGRAVPPILLSAAQASATNPAPPLAASRPQERSLTRCSTCPRRSPSSQ